MSSLKQMSPKVSIFVILSGSQKMLIFFLQIRDSNRAMVIAAASQQQCKVIDLGIACDDKAEIESALESAVSAGADLIITTGGVSMGDRDYVKPLLQKRGKIYFDKVMMEIFSSYPHLLLHRDSLFTVLRRELHSWVLISYSGLHETRKTSHFC